MTDETNRILDAALELPERDRAEIAVILESSLGDGSSPEEIQASWIAEVKRRIAAYERGETTAVDFGEVMARLRARLPAPRELGDKCAEAGRLLDAAMQLPEVDRARLATILDESIGDGTIKRTGGHHHGEIPCAEIPCDEVLQGPTSLCCPDKSVAFLCDSV